MSREGAQIQYWFDLGDVAVVPLIEDPRLLIDPEEFFPTGEGRACGWFREAPWCDPEEGRLVYLIQSFAVCDRDSVVLVDGCVGAGRSRQRAAFDHLPPTWQQQFQAAGLSGADVSAMVFTHLHVDHVGAATHLGADGWEPTFPGIPHYLAEAEFSYWTGESGRAALARTGDYLTDSVLPVHAAGDLVLIEPELEITPRVLLRGGAGHTPGNLMVQVTGSEGSLILTGDLVHHPLQLAHPGASTRYCVAGSQAARARAQLLQEAAETGTPIVPSHFAAPSIGRVDPRGEGYRFEPATDLLRGPGFDYRRWRAASTSS